MDELNCRIVSPNDAHPHANGISSADGGRNLIINDIDYGTSTVYAVDLQTKALIHDRTIVCSFCCTLHVFANETRQSAVPPIMSSRLLLPGILSSQ